MSFLGCPGIGISHLFLEVGGIVIVSSNPGLSNTGIYSVETGQAITESTKKNKRVLTDMNSGTRIICPHRVNNEFNLKFPEGYTN